MNESSSPPPAQKWTLRAGWIRDGLIALGAVLGAANDARALLGRQWAIGGIVGTLIVWLFIEGLLLYRHPRWRTSEGKSVWLTGLGERGRYAILGLLGLLLLPALLPVETVPIDRGAYTISRLETAWILELLERPSITPCLDWLSSAYGNDYPGATPRPAEMSASRDRESDVWLRQLDWSKIPNDLGTCEARDLISGAFDGGYPRLTFYKPPRRIPLEDWSQPVLDLLLVHRHTGSEVQHTLPTIPKFWIHWNARHRRLFAIYEGTIYLRDDWIASPKLVSAVDLAGMQLIAQRSSGGSVSGQAAGSPTAVEVNELSKGVRVVELELTVNSIRWVLKGAAFSSWRDGNGYPVYAYSFPSTVKATLDAASPEHWLYYPKEMFGVAADSGPGN